MRYCPVRNHLQRFLLFFSTVFGWIDSPVNTAWAHQLPVHLKADSLGMQPEGLVLDLKGWRFHPGDNPTWADASFTDNEWTITDTDFGKKHPLPGWQGIGWFRLWIRVDSTLADQVLVLRLDHVGASEIYLNGRRIGGFGKVRRSKQQMEAFAPYYQLTPLRLGNTRPHLIAIRYANFNPYFPHFPGFNSWIGTHGRLYPYVISQVRFNDYSLIGFAAQMALMLLHLFLFIFYPQQKSNLYYSLFVFFSAGIVLTSYVTLQLTDPALKQLAQTGLNLSKTLCTVMGVILLYSIGYASLPRWRIGLVGLGAVYLLLAYTILPGIYIAYSFMFYFLVVMADALRSLAQAVRLGQPGRKEWYKLGSSAVF